jgi:RNA polymerase sigma-70 factor (ECF subfamily)
MSSASPNPGGMIEPFDGALLAFPLDDAKFNQFQLQTERIVIGWALGFVWNRGDAEDLAQEMYVRLLRTVRQGGLKNTNNVRGFCGRILRNCAYDMIERRERMRTVESFQEDGEATNVLEKIAATEPLPDTEIAQRERVAALHRCVAALPPMFREIVGCLLEGEELKDIAAHLGISGSCAKERASRARKMLKDKLRAAGIKDSSGIV